MSQENEMLNVFLLKVSRSPRKPVESLSHGSSSRTKVSDTTSLMRGLNVCWSVPVNEGKNE